LSFFRIGAAMDLQRELRHKTEEEFLLEGFLGRHAISPWYGPPDSAKSVVKVHAQACVVGILRHRRA
jgi:hypothetical protein